MRQKKRILPVSVILSLRHGKHRYCFRFKITILKNDTDWVSLELQNFGREKAFLSSCMYFKDGAFDRYVIRINNKIDWRSISGQIKESRI